MSHSELFRPVASLAAMALACGLLCLSPANAQTTTPAPLKASLAPAGAAPARRAATPGGSQAATPDQLFAAWDKDRNKSLTLEEFSSGWEAAREQNIMSRLEGQFRAADKNQSGLLEAAEFANLPMIKRGGANAPAMSMFDANKDQVLNFKEYLTLVQTALKQSQPAR